MKDEEPKQESPEEPTMIDDWLNEYGDPEIYKKVEKHIEQVKKMEEQNYLDLIRFLRTQDKMGKSAEDLLEQFKMR